MTLTPSFVTGARHPPFSPECFKTLFLPDSNVYGDSALRGSPLRDRGTARPRVRPSLGPSPPFHRRVEPVETTLSSAVARLDHGDGGGPSARPFSASQTWGLRRQCLVLLLPHRRPPSSSAPPAGRALTSDRALLVGGTGAGVVPADAGPRAGGLRGSSRAPWWLMRRGDLLGALPLPSRPSRLFAGASGGPGRAWNSRSYRSKQLDRYLALICFTSPWPAHRGFLLDQKIKGRI